MSQGAFPLFQAADIAPQATGGPDDYGYTWDDSVAFRWVNATYSTNTGLTGKYKQVGPIALPFSFKFYENTYNRIYISTNGTLGFSGHLTNDSPEWVFPKPALPNNVIAPYWAPEDASTGGIYYASGGTAPNRWWAAEWYQVRDYDASSRLTFEAVLFENGDIEYRYQTMSYGSAGYWSFGIGIEDSAGLDGLGYLRNRPSNNLAVHFTRPAPSARLLLSPRGTGAFGVAETNVQFSQVIRNTGDFGLDTFDVFTSSSWPMTLYRGDGITPLTDTDGDDTVDTGPIPQGSSTTIVIKVAVPRTATVGQSNDGQLTVRSSLNTSASKMAPVRVAVPVPFVQSYSKNYNPYAGFYRPGGQLVKQTTTDSGYDPAVVTMPDGTIIQVWSQSRQNSNSRWVYELYYTVLDRQGNIVHPAIRIVDNSAATMDTYDLSPAVAVAPNGNIGVVWYRELWNSSNSTWNDNIYYLILNSAGGMVVPPANLTNNTLWAGNGPWIYDPNIAATLNNRFAMAWYREDYNGSSWLDTAWYTVRDAGGGLIKSPTQFSSDTCSWGVNLTSVNHGNVLLTQHACNGIGYGQLDSAGTVLQPLTNIPSAYGYLPDAVQLPDGNIVIAWSTYSNSRYSIQYAVLNSSFGTVKAVTSLASVSPVGDYYVSVTQPTTRQCSPGAMSVVVTNPVSTMPCWTSSATWSLHRPSLPATMSTITCACLTTARATRPILHRYGRT